MSAGRGTACARAALLGNPSDGYGGRTISFAFGNFSAEVEVEEGPRGDVQPGAARALLEATLAAFRRRVEAEGPAPPEAELAFRWRTTIPREVGLGGSSAIVIAGIRALCSLYEVSIPRQRLPALALSVETEGLGIEAGLQDRVAQTYEGLTYMDFEPEAMKARGHGSYESSIPGGCPRCSWPTRLPPPRRRRGRTVICERATSEGSRTSSVPWTRSLPWRAGGATA